MANSFNGIGTSFYGQSRFESDGSFVQTKWFILAFFPLIPLGSARVIQQESGGIPFISSSTSYEVLEELPMDWTQVIKIYLYAIFIVAWVGGFIVSTKPIPLKLIAIGSAIALPFVLRWLGKKNAGAV